MKSKSLRSSLGCMPGSERWPTSQVLQKFKKAFPFKFKILPIFLHHIFRLSAFSPVKVLKIMGSVPVFILPFFIFSIIALTPGTGNAMNGYLSTIVGQFPNTPNTCGLCHADWTGKGPRNNFGVMFWRDNGNNLTLSATAQTWDPDFDNKTTAVELGASPGKYPGYADKDGDGCIQLMGRRDEGGLVERMTAVPATAPTAAETCWDIDDNDPTAGNISWNTNPTITIYSADTTPPAAVADLRASSLGTGTQLPITWTAPGDDGNIGTAHDYDIRYTTEALVSAFTTQCAGGQCNVRNPSHWQTYMWDIPDCNVDGANINSTNALITKAGNTAVVSSCSSDGSVSAGWNTGEKAPLMRVLLEPVPLLAGNSQSMTIASIGAALSTNRILNGTTYWVAMRSSDGVVLPDFFNDATKLWQENLSNISNIVALTAGTTTTGAAIQSYTSTLGKSATSVVDVHGLGLGASGIITQGRLYDATLGTITCSIDGPTRTDIYLKLTCNTSAATNGQYDLDLRNASSVTKAAWVDGVQITDANTTTIDDNTNPTNKYPTGGATNQAVSAFNISTNNGTDTVTQIQVAWFGNGNVADISAVKLWRDVDANMEYSAGDVPIGITQVFSLIGADYLATFSSLSEPVDAILPPEKYIITFDVVASPTTQGTHYAKVFSFISGNASRVNNDNLDAVLAIDWTAPTTTASATGYTFDTWTNSGSVPVSLSGSDNVSGVASTTYCIDQTNTCTPTTSYTAAFNVTCATTCTQYVRYKSTDNSGNAEIVKSSIVKQDLQSPTDGTLSASPGDSQVVLNWTNATDSGSGLATANTYKVVFQTGATAPANCTLGTQIYLGTALTYTHTTLTNGTQYSYRVCAYDAVNNVSTGATASATPAATPQTIANFGASATSNKYAKGGEINLAVGTFELKTSSGTDTINQIVVSSAGTLADSNVASVRIFEDNGSTIYEYDATDTQVGALSPTFSAGTATFGPSLNIGVSATAKKYIIVYNIAASPSGSGTLQGRVSDITFTSANIKSIADTTDGTITVDISLPTGTVNINSSAAYTNSTSVNLTLSCSDTGGSGCYQMQFSNDGTAWSAWEAYNTAKAWTLTSGDGTKTVYAKFRDNALNESTSVTDTITLDTAAPTGTVTINSGNAYTNSATVTLTLTCGDGTGSGCYQMRISNDGVFDSEVWEAFATTKSSYNIGTGDGTKTVYVMFNDNASNATVSPTTDTIILDTAAPSVSPPTIPASGATGVSVSTTITVNFTNGPIKCSSVTSSTFYLSPSVSGSFNCPTSTQVVFTPGSTLASNTTYTVNLTTGITDEAGNALTAYSWSFTTQTVSDVTAPTWNSTAGAQYVGDSGAGGKLVLCFNGATDTSTPVSYFAYYNTTTPASSGTSVSIGSAPAAGDSASCGGSAYDYKYELTSITNGTKYYITARARDNVGNYTTNEDNKAAIPYNRTLSVNGYNMISVPGELGAGFSTSIFGDDLSYVRVMGWSGSYTSALNMTEGSGYWILNSTGDNTKKIDIDSSSGDCGSYLSPCYAAQVGPTVTVGFGGTKGWQLIGNPCLTNITGSNITVTLSGTSTACSNSSTCSFTQALNGNYVRNTIYRWNGSNYTTDAPLLTTGGNAEPWAGYWFYVYSSGTDARYATGITLTCGAQ